MASADLEVRVGLGKRLVIPGVELTELASRSSGPGGQHVNKVSSRVTLRWNALASEVVTQQQRERIRSALAARLTRRGLLVVHAQRHRSRSRNRELARARLAELVSGALVERPPRVRTRPSRAAGRRIRAQKEQRAALKRTRRRVQDLPDE